MIKRNIFEKKDEDLIVRIKIVPNSSKNDVIFEDEFLKFKITAQPIENKANKALIEYISKKLKTAKSNISIIKGELNKEKTILIKKITEAEFLTKFGL